MLSRMCLYVNVFADALLVRLVIIAGGYKSTCPQLGAISMNLAMKFRQAGFQPQVGGGGGANLIQPFS